MSGDGEDMNEKDLIALKMVYEERSITKASARMYVSQPSLTHRIKCLEAEFGVKILNRSPEGSFLTAQGEYILKYAEEMLTKLADTKEYVRNMESTIHGTLQLGVSHTFAQYELAPILSSYKKRFPDVEIYLKTELSSLLVSALQKNEVTVAISRRDASWSEKKHLLHEESLCIISSQPISDEEIPYSPWIRYEADPVMIRERDAWWSERFSFPPTCMQVHNRETSLQMVLHGLGWAIMPEIGLSKHRSLFTRPVLWKNGEHLVRKTSLLYKNSALERPAVKAFVKYILDVYKNADSTNIFSTNVT
jgi:DNA-binding transcriptional LysR family regulator